ncbi:proline-rich nuclear receptor coactivator motif-containing protein [Aspergillus thermomutatus]|uniref:Uncharacterized protein n=1 Tax=Aspergillus thermomutatus TaxID=41047 RepID=A0A397HD61_ASPTH|nr:uncharacterized protein CDV56_108906 [Aspergillus thermomutatus]RHZ61081.1 hypothetical protein CDV56_108906 [Aspergillus thermomutatus]
MSSTSPTPPTPKGSRNNRRNQKKTTTPSNQKVALLTTPPSSPPRNSSPGEAVTDTSVNLHNPSKRKNPRSNRKPRDAPKPSPAHNNGHRHTLSHPANNTPQVKDSPHYAGPTFHASPAPSALPIPSFFSKSVPESDPVQEIDVDHFEAGPDLDSTPSKPRPHFQPQSEKPQSTPLDFLFKAAVEARNSQLQRSPEANIGARSPQTDSKVQHHQIPNGRNGASGGVFPLEMEKPDLRNSQIGPSFATSYKDRMNALRSSSSPSSLTSELDEEERRAKTEALKDLLLNPRPQRPSTASILNHDQAIGHTARPNLSPNVPHYATPMRTTSGPPATLLRDMPPERKQPSFGNGLQSPFYYSSSAQQLQSSTMNKGIFQPSPLNAISVSGGAASSPLETYGSSKSSQSHAQQPACYVPAHHQPFKSEEMPANSSAPPVDTKKMEDDLRRILKLDANPSFASNGIQSSFA